MSRVGLFGLGRDIKRVERSYCLDYKVILGECVATQHRLLVLDIRLRKMYRKMRCVINPRIKWWKLKGDSQTHFVRRLIKEANWEDEVDSNVMWNKIVLNMWLRRTLVNLKV